MGRNNTKAVKNIAKMYEQLGLAQDDIFHKTKLLLSIYRDVVWATLSDCNCVNEEIYYYGDDLTDAFVDTIVAAVETRKVRTKDKNAQDKIDAVLTHPIAGLIIFAGVMFLVFQISQGWVGPWIADYLTGWLGSFQEWVAGLVENSAPVLRALLVDGIIGGVGNTAERFCFAPKQ